MIAANAVWLGIDVTYNTEILLINSAPVFIIMENIFCTYFFWEIVIRFGAFRKKCNVFRDFWFVFDFALVLAMVVDTWALLVIMQRWTPMSMSSTPPSSVCCGSFASRVWHVWHGSCDQFQKS